MFVLRLDGFCAGFLSHLLWTQILVQDLLSRVNQLLITLISFQVLVRPFLLSELFAVTFTEILRSHEFVNARAADDLHCFLDQIIGLAELHLYLLSRFKLAKFWLLLLCLTFKRLSIIRRI